MRKTLIASLIALASLVPAVGCSSGFVHEQIEQTAADNPTKAKETAVDDGDLYDMPLGTEVTAWEGTMDDTYRLSVSSTDETVVYDPTYESTDLYSQPDHTPVVFAIHVEHVTGSPTPYDSDIVLQTVDGSIYPALPIEPNSPHSYSSGHALYPGEKRDGLIWFDVPAGQVLDKLIYAPGGASNIAGSWKVG